MCFRLSVCLCLLSLSCSFSVAEEIAAADKVSGLDQLIKINNKVDQELHSYEAEGRFREYAIFDDDFKLTRDAKITVKCKGGLYYIDMKFDSNSQGYQRRIIYYDGSQICTSYFTPRISITGAAGEIIPKRASRSGVVSPQIANFPWDPAHLRQELSSLPLVISNVGYDRISYHKTPKGEIEVTYLVGRKGESGIVRLQYPQKAGLHLSDYEYVNPDGRMMQSYHLKWSEIEGLWCIKKMVEVSHIADKKWELEFNTISPNAEIDEKTFTIESLDLPDRSRIIDRGRKTLNRYSAP